jgi:hypothetical protein
MSSSEGDFFPLFLMMEKKTIAHIKSKPQETSLYSTAFRPTGAHPASYPMVIEVFSPGNKAAGA